MITILMGCRSKSGGNDNSHLREFLASLTNASSPDAYEVLIKFDEDDPGLGDLLSVVNNAVAKGKTLYNRDTGEPEGEIAGQKIRYIITPRGKGYGDLHKAYLDLLTIASPKSSMYWVLSDDVILLGASWDLYLQHAAKQYLDGMFVICPMFLANYKNMSDAEALNMCDNYPVWSAGFVAAMGGFGYTFSTDGWTNLLCRKLYTLYGVDRRIACRQINLQRRNGSQDSPGSERWNGVRKDTHDLLLSPQLQLLLEGQAKAIVGSIEKR